MATSVATVALVGFAAEHLVRAAVNRALAPLHPENTNRVVRAVVTEITVVERFHRD